VPSAVAGIDPGVDRGVRRARLAVAGLFLANGALFAGLVPRYPEIIARLHLSNAAFGTAVAGYGVGALALGLVSGFLVARWGSARVAWVTTVLVAGNLVLVAVAPSWWVLAAVLVVAGGLDSLADTAENAHALRVERRYGRSILVSLHGLWSIGAVVGGGLGALAAGLGVPLAVQFGAVGLVLAGAAVGLGRLLLPGSDRDDRADVAEPGAGGERRPARRALLATGRSVLTLGLLGAAGQVLEDAGATWSPIYLRHDLAAAAAVAGLGFIALQASQTVARLLGDRVVTRWGDRAVARAGALLAGGAMAAGLLAGSVPATIAAFAVVGLGIGTFIPASLRAADALPGMRPGVALGLVGTVPRLAVLVGPVVVGLVADATSLRLALLEVPLAAAAAFLLARALPGQRATGS
jgi:MFS family permease